MLVLPSSSSTIFVAWSSRHDGSSNLIVKRGHISLLSQSIYFLHPLSLMFLVLFLIYSLFSPSKSFFVSAHAHIFVNTS
jgi:hypothetical protein